MPLNKKLNQIEMLFIASVHVGFEGNTLEFAT